MLHKFIFSLAFLSCITSAHAVYDIEDVKDECASQLYSSNNLVMPKEKTTKFTVWKEAGTFEFDINTMNVVFERELEKNISALYLVKTKTDDEVIGCVIAQPHYKDGIWRDMATVQHHNSIYWK